CVTTEATSNHQKLYDPPRKGKIIHTTPVSAMDASGNRSARWAQTNASRRPDRNNSLITFVVRTLYNKSTRHQTGALECLLHGADSPPNQSARHPSNCIKSDGVERPFEPASKVPNVVAWRGATKEGPYH